MARARIGAGKSVFFRLKQARNLRSLRPVEIAAPRANAIHAKRLQVALVFGGSHDNEVSYSTAAAGTKVLFGNTHQTEELIVGDRQLVADGCDCGCFRDGFQLFLGNGSESRARGCAEQRASNPNSQHIRSPQHSTFSPILQRKLDDHGSVSRPVSSAGETPMDTAQDILGFFAMCAFLCAVALWLPVLS